MSNKRRGQKPVVRRSMCLSCGELGSHYVPPSLGEPGFFTCQAGAVTGVLHCPGTAPNKENHVAAPSATPVKPAEELHQIALDLSAALTAIQTEFADLVQRARANEQPVAADDLLSLHNAVSEAQSIAANAVSVPQGTPPADEEGNQPPPSNTLPANGDAIPPVDASHTDDAPAAPSDSGDTQAPADAGTGASAADPPSAS